MWASHFAGKDWREHPLQKFFPFKLPCSGLKIARVILPFVLVTNRVAQYFVQLVFLSFFHRLRGSFARSQCLSMYRLLLDLDTVILFRLLTSKQGESGTSRWQSHFGRNQDLVSATRSTPRLSRCALTATAAQFRALTRFERHANEILSWPQYVQLKQRREERSTSLNSSNRFS